MRGFPVILACALLAAAWAWPSDVRAAAAPPIKVGVALSPPFVEKAGDPGSQQPFEGFAIDLWRATALELGRESAFTAYPTFDALVDAAAKGEIDVAVSDISATSERAARVDFSYPIADGGLRTMVAAAPKHSLAALWRGLVERGHVEIVLYGGGILLVASAVLVFVWRRIDHEFPQTVHDGFAESLYRTVSITVSGKTKVVSTTNWITKILAALWLVCGVGIVAYVTSSITAVMTAEAASGGVQSVSDLKDKAVGVLGGSVGERYAREAGLATRPFPSIAAAARALVDREIAGIVADGPALEAFDHAHPELPVSEVGPLFAKHKYAFAFPRGSALRGAVDAALIGLEERGDTAKLAARYFGAN